MNADGKESLARGAHSPHECYTVIREYFALQIFCTLNFRVNNAHIVNNVHNFRALNFRTGHAVRYYITVLYSVHGCNIL